MGWKRKLLLGLGGLVGIVVVGAGGFALYGYSTFEGKLYHPDTPYPKVAASTDEGAVERGRYLVRGPAHCSHCHADYKREDPSQNTATVALSGGFEFAMGPLGTMHAANLTPHPTAGIGRLKDEEIARVMRTGILPDGHLSMFMRYSAATPSDSDLADIIAYLRSEAPVDKAVPGPEWGPLAKAMSPIFPLNVRTTPAPAHVPAGEGPTVERGAYLAENLIMCIGCHTAYDMSTFENVGPKGAGGSPDPSHGAEDSNMEYAPPNLTSDPTVGFTGRFSEDQFLERMHKGRAYNSSIMPWENIQRTSDDDLRSIYRYLKSLPPSSNDPGPAYRQAGWKPAEKK